MEFPQFCGPSYLDSSPTVDQEETVNFYLEAVESGNSKNKSGYVMKRSPGMSSVFSVGFNTIGRGMFSLNGHIFAVLGDTIYDLLFNGVNLTINGQLGPIANDGTRVQFAADPEATQLSIYSAGNLYVIYSGTLSNVNWMPVAPAGLAMVNGFFCILSSVGDGFFWSEPGDVRLGTPLNFTPALSSGNKFISILIDHGQVWLFGNANFGQVFSLSTADPNNPFVPNLSAIIPHGTGAAASPISFNLRVWWIGDHGIAFNSNGYTPQRISTHAVENRWRSYPTIADAVSWTAEWNGHHMWRIWFPSGNETWEFDTDMAAGLGWRKVADWDAGNAVFVAHRGSSSCQYGSATTNILNFVTDRANGNIYVMTPDNYFTNGQRIPCLRISPDVEQELHKIVFDWLEMDMQTGLGDGSAGGVGATPEFEPVISISYSRDSGMSWSGPYQRSLGQQGQNTKRVTVPRFAGTNRKICIKIVVSAACPVNINTVYLGDPEAEAA